MELMKSRKISGDDLYRMIDVDKNKVIELSEMEEEIGKLDGDFSKKEMKSIHDFFDINNDGKVDQLEFLSQVQDGTKKYEKYL